MVMLEFGPACLCVSLVREYVPKDPADRPPVGEGEPRVMPPWMAGDTTYRDHYVPKVSESQRTGCDQASGGGMSMGGSKPGTRQQWLGQAVAWKVFQACVYGSLPLCTLKANVLFHRKAYRQPLLMHCHMWCAQDLMLQPVSTDEAGNPYPFNGITEYQVCVYSYCSDTWTLAAVKGNRQQHET